MLSSTAFVFHIRNSSNVTSGRLYSRQSYRTSFQPQKTNLEYGKIALIVIPVTTFCLGCWQWKRHQWKTNLLDEIRKGMKRPPVEFPLHNFIIALLDQMEYQRVHVRGTYLFDRQFQIIWRRRFDRAAKTDCYGSQIYTPLKVDGTDLIIMVNRGWLPPREAELELASQRGKHSSSTVEFNGVVRKSEKPNWFLRNEPERGIWVDKNLQQMAELCGASPILVDADYESTKPGGPIGGQTNVNLRNEHFNYMIQWFGISAVTLVMWLQIFRK